MPYRSERKHAFLKFMVDEEKFIKRFLAYIIEKADENGLDHSKLARNTFKIGTADPVRKWRRIRSKSKLEKPQELKFSEAIALANAIGLDIATVSLEIRELIKRESPVKNKVPQKKTNVA